MPGGHASASLCFPGTLSILTVNSISPHLPGPPATCLCVICEAVVGWLEISVFTLTMGIFIWSASTGLTGTCVLPLNRMHASPGDSCVRFTVLTTWALGVLNVWSLERLQGAPVRAWRSWARFVVCRGQSLLWSPNRGLRLL